MDFEIDPMQKRRKRTKRLMYGGAVVVVAFLLFRWGMGLVKPSIKRSRIRTAVVDSGPVLETLSANGIVVPRIERLLTCPLNTRILAVLAKKGDPVDRGCKLLDLDRTGIMLELSRIDEKIALKRNRKEKLRIEMERSLIDLGSALDIGRLELKTQRAKVDTLSELLAMGAIAEDEIRHERMTRDITAIEVRKLERSIENMTEAMKINQRELDLEIGLLERDRVECVRRLESMDARADREGVLTWIVDDEGAYLKAGDVMARIADLTSFRVKASISELYASRLSIGLPVIVSISDDEDLDGEIISVLPTIENGIVTFLVELEQCAHENLRSNLRVDVYVVSSRRDRTLRIRRGPFAGGEGIHEVFVIENNRAHRKPVRFGISSYEFYEVLEGLAEGDSVIISDMDDYLRLRSVGIR
jgi:HlyD family secretion protein